LIEVFFAVSDYFQLKEKWASWKTLEMEQFKLVQQFYEENRQTVMEIINTMLTKAKIKAFFNKNIAAL
jgi:hypothetical protein